jgi:hypothetical protein
MSFQRKDQPLNGPEPQGAGEGVWPEERRIGDPNYWRRQQGLDDPNPVQRVPPGPYQRPKSGPLR